MTTPPKAKTTINLPFDPAELDEVTEASRKAGLARTEYIRRACRAQMALDARKEKGGGSG